MAGEDVPYELPPPPATIGSSVLRIEQDAERGYRRALWTCANIGHASLFGWCCECVAVCAYAKEMWQADFHSEWLALL